MKTSKFAQRKQMLILRDGGKFNWFCLWFQNSSWRVLARGSVVWCSSSSRRFSGSSSPAAGVTPRVASSPPSYSPLSPVSTVSVMTIIVVTDLLDGTAQTFLMLCSFSTIFVGTTQGQQLLALTCSSTAGLCASYLQCWPWRSQCTSTQNIEKQTIHIPRLISR